MNDEPDRIHTALDEAAARAAAERLARLDRGIPPSETLAGWRSADPRRDAELARMTDVWQQLDAARSLPRLRAMADAIEARARRRRARRQTFLSAAALLAAAAAVAVCIHWTGLLSTPAGTALEQTQANPGNHWVLASTAQRLWLPDGSVAELNGDSEIETSFTGSERCVRLLRGEAHFSVAKNPNRPFLVSVGPITVRAVGTAFDVRHEAQTVDVLVTEGSVSVEGAATPAPAADDEATPLVPALSAGQRAVVDVASGAASVTTVGSPASVELHESLAWRTTRLAFDRTPLDEVVAAFNQRNAHQLKLGHPALARRTLTGVFRADNVEGFIRIAHATVDVVPVQESPNLTVLQPAR
ncbi:MAG TPA: FecR domain-containing protein [Opitutaceae bacterium]